MVRAFLYDRNSGEPAEGLRQRPCKLPNPKGLRELESHALRQFMKIMYDQRELIGILQRQELSVGESMDDSGNAIYWITGRDGMVGAEGGRPLCAEYLRPYKRAVGGLSFRPELLPSWISPNPNQEH
jgi:hypothetical protein